MNCLQVALVYTSCNFSDKYSFSFFLFLKPKKVDSKPNKVEVEEDLENYTANILFGL